MQIAACGLGDREDHSEKLERDRRRATAKAADDARAIAQAEDAKRRLCEEALDESLQPARQNHDDRDEDDARSRAPSQPPADATIS